MAKSSRLLLYGLLVWAPLPLGSNRPVIWAINGLWAGLILALFLIEEVRRGGSSSTDWRIPAWFLAAAAVWVGWMVIQAVPGVPEALQHPLWRQLSDSLTGAAGAISIAPGSTWTTVCQVLPAVLLPVVAMRLASDRGRALFLLNLVVAVAVGVALYGLAAQYFDFKSVFLTDTVAYRGFLTSTFVGRNAAATYFAIGLACASALLANAFETQAATAQDTGRRGSTMRAARRAAVYLAACLVLLAAVLNTGSRGGLIASVIALLCVVTFWTRRSMAGKWSVVAVVGLAAIAMTLVFVASSGLLFDRLESGLGDGDRLLAYRDTIRMILSRPLLGQGGGAFADAFPLFHDRAPAEIFWNAAHNSYLQAAAELGLPVFAILMAGIGAVVIALARGIWAQPRFSPVAVAALGACAAVAFHSTVDFSIQFQAVGLTLAVLMGAGLGEVATPAARSARAHSRQPAYDDAEQNAAVAALLRRNTVNVSVPGIRYAVPVPTVSLAPIFEEPAPPAKRPPDPARQLRLPAPATFAPLSHGAIVTPPPDRGPGEKRIYAFGDLHGRADLLYRLGEAISRDRAASPCDDVLVIGLGDYVDRGPDSKGVVDALVGGLFACETVFLRGNHEQMLLDFLEEPARFGPRWFRFGALETLRSYGVNVGATARSPDLRFGLIRDDFARRIHPSHIGFLQRLPTHFETEKHFFAHAGARPGIPLSMQTAADLLWMRKGFADRDRSFEKTVVHGHTPVEKPYFGKYRVNLDTGAYFTDRLSCLVIEKGSTRILDNAFDGVAG